MSAPDFQGYPEATLPAAVNDFRRGLWVDLERWLSEGPVAETDAWLDAHRDYHGPSTPVRTYNLRRAVRIWERDGAEASEAWLYRVENEANAKAVIAAAEAQEAAHAPRPVDRVVDGTIAATVTLPLGALATLAAYVGFGSHAALAAATFTAGLAMLNAFGAAIVARRQA